MSDHQFRPEYQHERHERRFVERRRGCGGAVCVVLACWGIVGALLYFLLRRHH